jgi:small subunit ribosomal protein S4
MGDPRKQRKKYTRPSHPWEGERIQKENELLKKYGLKNKKEVWKAKSAIAKFRQQARDLLGTTGEEAEKEAKGLLNRLTNLGVLNNYSLEGVLALTIDDLLERRFQTLVYKKGFANTVDQARQFVTHKHVILGNNVVNVPGYIVPRGKEETILLKGISRPIPEEKAGKQNVKVRERVGKHVEEIKERIEGVKIEEVKEEIKDEQ